MASRGVLCDRVSHTLGCTMSEDSSDRLSYLFSHISFADKMYDYGYISFRGDENTKDLAEKVRLSPDDIVLDIGSGLGGFAFYIAKHYDVKVTGVDIAREAVEITQERCVAMGLSDKVNFILQDATLSDFPAESFSVIHLGGSLLHVKQEDKLPLLKKVKKWFRPGGRLILCDICIGDVPAASQKEFKRFLEGMEFQLLEQADYQQIVADAGLQVQAVHCEDRSLLYLEAMKETRSRVATNKANIVKEVPEETFDFILAFWSDYQKWFEVGALKEILVLGVNQ